VDDIFKILPRQGQFSACFWHPQTKTTANATINFCMATPVRN
jgi:hypothetical protein